MPVERWETEVLILADAVVEQAELNRLLENRHLEGYGIERAGTVLKLLEQRGRDVMPYVRAKLEETIGGWGKDAPAKRFVELAERKAGGTCGVPRSELRPTPSCSTNASAS